MTPRISAATAPVAGTSPAGAAGTATPLMPEPAPLAGPGIDDALALLYRAMAKLRTNGTAAGSERVQSTELAKQQELQKQEAARQRQEANQADHGPGFFSSIGHLLDDVAGDLTHLQPDRALDDGVKDVSDAVNSPAFWHDVEEGAMWVAKIAAVVGSSALTVASFGTAGATMVLVGVALAASSEVVSRTKAFGNASSAVALGLDLAGVAAGVGGSFATATSGAAAVAKAGLVKLGTAAEATSGGATMVQGGAHVRNTNFEADAQEAAADATQAARDGARMQTLVDRVIDEMKSDDKARQKGLQIVQGTMEANDQAVAAAASVTMKG